MRKLDIRRNNSARSLLRAGLCLVALALGSSVAQAADAPSDANLSLKGKRIGITAIGTDHYWDLQAYQAQIKEVKLLGGIPIAVDANRKDAEQIAQIQTLIAQRPDAIIEQLGNIKVLNPWLKKIREAGIPLFTVDTQSQYSINDTTSDNFSLGAQVALQMVEDLHGSGNILVFNGFYSVPVCAIRYDELREVLKFFPNIKIIQPELRDVIPNTVQSAYADVTQMLAKYPKKGSIKAIWSAWDVPQVGATEAVAAAGRTEIKTYAIDGSPDVVAMVQDPKSPAAAVGAQLPAEIGKTAVDNAARYLNGDKNISPFTFVHSILVTKANAAETVPELHLPAHS